MSKTSVKPFSLHLRRVYVAGHSGMVGSAIVRRLALEDCQILTADRKRLDLRRQADVEAWIGKNRPDVVERFVRAVRRGYEEAASDPQAGVDILLKGTDQEIDEAIERPGADLLAPLWRTDTVRFGDQEAARWDTFTRWMQANGLLSADVTAGDAFTNRFGGGD